MMFAAAGHNKMLRRIFFKNKLFSNGILIVLKIRFNLYGVLYTHTK